MANEARITAGLQLIGPLLQNFSSGPQAYQADVSVAGGPSPGEFLAALAGTDVNLTNLNVPGLAFLMNLGVDSLGNDLRGTAGQQASWTNYVEYGIVDHTSAIFYPLGELLPGEWTVIRLSRFINQDFTTGAGTHPSTNVAKFRFKAIGTACKVIINAFEK